MNAVRSPVGSRARTGTPILTEIATIVTPDPVAWHRKLLAQKYDGSGKLGRRPRTVRATEALWYECIRESDWGYVEFLVLCPTQPQLALGTRRISEAHGSEPAPDCRSRKLDSAGRRVKSERSEFKSAKVFDSIAGLTCTKQVWLPESFGPTHGTLESVGCGRGFKGGDGSGARRRTMHATAHYRMA